MYATLTGGSGKSGDVGNAFGLVSIPGLLGDLPTSYECSGFECVNTAAALRHYNPLPIMLGGDFLLSLSGSAFEDGRPYSGGEADWNLTFTFQLAELDGTPVEVEAAEHETEMSDAPEPTTWSLLGVSFATMAFLSRRKSYYRQ